MSNEALELLEKTEGVLKGHFCLSDSIKLAKKDWYDMPMYFTN